MKFGTLLIMGALAVGAVGCNRNAPDESVSANGERTDQTASAQSNDNAKSTTLQREQETVRDTRPAAPPVEKQTRRSAEPTRTDDRVAENRAGNRIENRNDAVTTRRRTATVPDGTALTVTLADAVSTDGNKEGDAFTAHLSQPITINGDVVAEKGDRVTGHITKVDEPGRVKGRARLELVLDEIRTSKNTYELSTEPFIAVAEDTHTRDAAEIGGGAAVGAAIGAIAGGKKGAAIGAVIGGGTGTTAVLVTRGQQLRLEPETKVNFVLSKSVSLPVIRSTNT